MESVVSNHVLNVLCDHQCWMEFRHLAATLRQRLTVDEQLLLRVLTNSGSFCIIDEEQRDSAINAVSPTALILARTELRLCTDPSTCSECQKLHLCRYLVCGNCKHGNLQNLGEAQLFQLLLQNDPALIPEICSHYNKGNEGRGSCKFDTSCTSLHICQHFLQDDCRYNEECLRTHQFDEAAIKNLKGRGFSPENISNLYKIYKNKFLIAAHNDKPISKAAQKDRPFRKQHSSNSVSEADRNEICLYFIRKGCSFKEKCVRVHHDLPYKWEILDKDGVTWNPLPSEEDIERSYCNPTNDKSVGDQPVDFTLMICEGKPVRRLSTASSVTKPPHFILTTEWLWYWKNKEGEWIEYGQTEHANSINSKTLEDLYLAEVETEIPFTLGDNNYVLNFKDMYQKNTMYKTERDVRRRPRFVSAQDKGESKSDAPESSSSSTTAVPDYWDKEALPGVSYTIVTLSSSADDYKKIDSLFKRTMPTNTVHHIKRVQNPSLWKFFQWQKEQMKERNEGSDVVERYLFHGTDQSLIEAICEQNFDWRVCGVHGSLYGKGSYFARDAKYSDKYAKSKGAAKMMFVALVLVGEFIKGSSSYQRPPIHDKKKGFYDSCVDNVTNPAIFVIFEKFQIYPEYIIEYS
ncbi:protein mono-ADP-ribosyltransferase PARP12-like isoform X2 [Trichomycterus rosablanca]|uniref:protein mono-ADP-ribosyltransferase PARP12-like isoform X2 n=1 Tax=Trichomycterus rosablanca TaxID=2290929 RepID=UPI002F35BFD5